MERGGPSSHFSTPTRRASAVLLSKSRPTTSGDVYALPQPNTRSPANYNRMNRYSYQSPPTYTNSDWLDSESGTMDHERVLIVDGRIDDPFSQFQFQSKAVTPQVRRTSSFAESFKNGLHNVRSLGRRMSLSIRGKPRPVKEELATSNVFENRGKRRSMSNADKSKPIQHLPLRDDSRPVSRTRRVPSMPILHNYRHSQIFTKPDRNPSDLRLHSHRRTTVIVRPDVLQGGAGARASAAARNAELQLARQTPLPPYRSRPSSPEDELRDNESGIGIITDDLDGLTLTRHRSRSPHVAKKNPADVLPGELLEHMLAFLDASDLLEVELVSKQWKALSRSQTVWRQVFFREYAPSRSQRVKGAPPTAGLGKNKPSQDYKKLYEVRRRIDNRWNNGKAAAIYLDGHKDSVYCVQFDEDKIITGSRDNTIRVWDARTYQCIRKLGPPNNPRERNQLIRPEVSPQGTVPFITESAPTAEPHLTETHIWHQASVLCLQYDQEILVTGSSDYTCIVWDITQNYRPLFRLYGHKAGVLDVCINATTIVTCSKDTTIKIWDRFTGELLRTLTGHRGPVNAVQLRGNLLASASGDGMSKLWQLDTGLCIKEFQSKERGLACVEFSEDGRSIFAGGNDHVIYEYNTVSGDVKRELQGHKDLVRSLHLDTANSRLISGSYDHSIKVWNAHHGQSEDDGGLRLNLEGWTSSWMLAAKSNYRKIACASQDGRVVIVDFGYGINSVDLVEARC